MTQIKAMAPGVGRIPVSAEEIVIMRPGSDIKKDVEDELKPLSMPMEVRCRRR